MVLVEEVPEEPDTVELVVRVGFVELLQDPQLLQAGLMHHLVIPDDLDGHLLVHLQGVARSHHIAEHALARVTVHRVASVQLLADTHTYTATWKASHMTIT